MDNNNIRLRSADVPAHQDGRQKKKGLLTKNGTWAVFLQENKMEKYIFFEGNRKNKRSTLIIQKNDRYLLTLLKIIKNITVLNSPSAWLCSSVQGKSTNTDTLIEHLKPQKSLLSKWQTCCGWSLPPPPPPARTATSDRSGTPLHTCVSRIQDRGRSSPYNPHPDSRTCPCCWRAGGLCCRTLCSWLQGSACMHEVTNRRLFTAVQQFSLVLLKYFPLAGFLLLAFQVDLYQQNKMLTAEQKLCLEMHL